MKKHLAPATIAAVCIVLSGCGDHYRGCLGPNNSVADAKAAADASLIASKEALEQAKIDAQTALIHAKSSYDVAVLEAKAQHARAMAAADENKLIEGSVKDASHLKNWQPATFSSSFATQSTAAASVGGPGVPLCQASWAGPCYQPDANGH